MWMWILIKVSPRFARKMVMEKQRSRLLLRRCSMGWKIHAKNLASGQNTNLLTAGILVANLLFCVKKGCLKLGGTFWEQQRRTSFFFIMLKII